MKETEEALNVNIPNNLMNEFREKATKKFGYKRGHVKKATIEAIQDWILKEKLSE